MFLLSTKEYMFEAASHFPGSTTVSVSEIWQQTCQILQQNLSPTSYSTWIANTALTDFRLIGPDRAIGVITSPSAFHSTTVEKNFYAQIKEVLDRVTGRNSELQFQVGTPTVVTTTVSLTPTPPASSTQEFTEPDLNNVAAVPAATQQTIALAIESSFLNTDTSLNQATAPVHTPPPTSPQSTLVSAPPPTLSRLSISSLQNRLIAMSQQAQTPQTTSTFNDEQRSHAPSTSANQHTRPYQPDTSSGTSGELFSTQTVSTMTFDRARLQAQKAGLRLDYTFDTFAVSTTNEMAHAAALAVSSQPGTAYNPLFIYGGVGVGKTHLMHAVGNNILKNNPEAKLMYCTGEDFTNEIVSAIQNKKAMQFKERYRTVDVLLIDDVQFIAGKNTVQEEFFHTFNTITKRFGQVIMTSDQPPHAIALLEDRLRSRFEAGLMVDIQQPSFELRTAILLIKAKTYHLEIPMPLAQIIAARVDSARKIEGIMKTLKSEVELKHRQISPELIDQVCQTEGQKVPQRLRMKPYDLIKEVSDFYQLKQTVVRGKQRVKDVVRARHVAMYLLKQELQLPYIEIGRWFSNRDHTSAMHALNKITHELTNDQKIYEEVQAIRTQLMKLSK